ncbi:MAG: PBECR2 nuclease fold domain-containing protein [Oscillospiraceae bacterium]|nr:PBECR2 nuclease fold domain-containing protein [Oscillospiraceae bacterium]
MEYFNIDNLHKRNYLVGRLTQKVINLLRLTLIETDILISKDKIRYTLKHAEDFKSYEQYKKCFEMTPDIITNPDYVALHPNGESIEYIKQVDDLVLLAVRIKAGEHLWVSSFFPITRAKLNKYIKEGTAKRFSK